MEILLDVLIWALKTLPILFLGFLIWAGGFALIWGFLKKVFPYIIGLLFMPVLGVYLLLQFLRILPKDEASTPAQTDAGSATFLDARQLAGKRAEDYVQRQMQSALPAEFQFHGALLVFHKGEEREFSREIDHIYVGEHAVFVVETKYKAGTVTASADADEWFVEDGQPMRNALKQAKKACEVLSDKLCLPRPIFFPVVAIYSPEGTVLIDAPSNVLRAQDVPEYLNMSDAAYRPQAKFNPDEIMAAIAGIVSQDPADLERHLSRANDAKIKEHSKKITNSASLI